MIIAYFCVSFLSEFLLFDEVHQTGLVRVLRVFETGTYSALFAMEFMFILYAILLLLFLLSSKVLPVEVPYTQQKYRITLSLSSKSSGRKDPSVENTTVRPGGFSTSRAARPMSKGVLSPLRW